MELVRDVIYLDSYRYGREGKAFIGNTFIIDLNKKGVVFSDECLSFLDNVKNCIVCGNDNNLVTLSVYRSKAVFENVICRGILDLEYRGCIMDTVCYEVPSNLKESDFNEIYNFLKVRCLVEQYYEK